MFILFLSGVFNGPQIKQLIKNNEFIVLLNSNEKRAFQAANDVIENFLGNNRSNNYKQLVEKMINAYAKMGVNMSLKIHFLHNHLEFFPENCGAFSDEHGERFHQDIKIIEQRFKGKEFCRMLGEYCWSICRNSSDSEYKRQANRKQYYLTK